MICDKSQCTNFSQKERFGSVSPEARFILHEYNTNLVTAWPVSLDLLQDNN